MAVRAALGGNFTTAGSWGLVDATSYLNSENGAETLTTAYSGTRTAIFAPGAITVDGIGVKISNRTGTTGTMSVSLYNDSLAADVVGTEVTINTADLPAITLAEIDGGWIFFKFAAPVLLLVATNYRAQAKTSSGSQINVYRDAVADNFSRILRTTTTGAPSAGDDLIITREFTGAGTSNTISITMDSTAATDYGAASTSTVTPALAISTGGTLIYGTTAATNYVLRISGQAVVYQGGTLNIGTVATPIPRDSSAVLEFDCPADGSFGLVLRNGSTWNSQGLSRTLGKDIFKCFLNTDEAVAQTVLGVDADTGWLNGDEIGIASTTRTYTECEKRTLSGNAGATTVTVTAGLTNAHSGTSPTQAEVILLTRNVKIRAVNSTFPTFVDIKTTCTMDVDWTEFYYIGNAVTGQRGIEFESTTGTCNIQYSSIHDCEDFGVVIGGTTVNNITFSNNVMYNLNSLDATGGSGFVVLNNTSGTSITVSNNTMILCGGTTSGAGYSLNDLGIVFTNNTIAGSKNYGIKVSEDGALGTFSGNTIHSCADYGLTDITGISNYTFTNTTIWRCNNNGLNFGTISNNLVFDTLTCFGNLNANVQVASIVGGYTFKNFTSNGDTTFSTTVGFNTIAQGIKAGILFESCDFSTVSGIKTAHTTDINPVVDVNDDYIQIRLENCKLGAATEIGSAATLPASTLITSQRHDQTVGNHKTWKRGGVLANELTIFNTATPSESMTPVNASFKLESGSKLVPVLNGQTVTANWYVYKNATYNGAAPRLIVKRNVAAGISADTVLDTHTAAVETWEQLTGTTIAATDDTALEFVIDCDGTAGIVYNDDFTASVA